MVNRSKVTAPLPELRPAHDPDPAPDLSADVTLTNGIMSKIRIMSRKEREPRPAMFTPEWPMLGYRLDDAEPAISVA